MKRYKIYHSNRFDKELVKFDKSFQEWVDKLEDKLIFNPYSGDPLGVKWFREKKHGKYRIYFLIYDDLEAVFMVAISDKKDQQIVINTINFLLESFKKEIENLVNKDDIT